MEKNMNRTVSWSEAFSFWVSLFWRSFILFFALNFAIMFPLALIFSKEHPAALSIIGLILVTILFWFAMVIPIKIVLQRYKNEILPNRYQQG
jgi:lipopolysaccharide export LptBFGC system permease protein LptF